MPYSRSCQFCTTTIFFTPCRQEVSESNYLFADYILEFICRSCRDNSQAYRNLPPLNLVLDTARYFEFLVRVHLYTDRFIFYHYYVFSITATDH
jgi:hypothetical protein